MYYCPICLHREDPRLVQLDKLKGCYPLDTDSPQWRCNKCSTELYEEEVLTKKMVKRFIKSEKHWAERKIKMFDQWEKEL